MSRSVIDPAAALDSPANELRAKPTPADFGLTDAAIAREIRKDSAHAWYFGNSRLTPGGGAGLLVLSLMITLATWTRAITGVMLVCAAPPVAALVARVVNRAVRASLRHSDRYFAYRRACVQYRLNCDPLDRSRPAPAGDLRRPPRTGGIFLPRDDEDSAGFRPQSLAA